MAANISLLTAIGLSMFVLSCSKTGVSSREIDSVPTTDGIFAAIRGGAANGDSTLVAGKITAGEWNDLSNWGFWEGVLAKPAFEKFPAYWGFNTSSRISIQLKNEQGFILVDEPLRLIDANGVVLAETRTDNKGTCYFFPYQDGVFKGSRLTDLVININHQTFKALKTHDAGVNELVISKPITIPSIADIAFVVDATSSMSDEISYLKAELDDVIKKVEKNYSTLTVNTASVFYRDAGDTYITRIKPFSPNFQPILDFIKDQQADGGGDYPEAVHSGLKASIEGLNWSPNARARLLFLLLDAPPHYEQTIVEDIHNSIKIAVKNGIKIIPVTASGIDKETEFLMRYFSIRTNGTYVFITNHSSIGDEHLEPSVGQYEVEYLNDLMVRLIGKYLQ